MAHPPIIPTIDIALLFEEKPLQQEEHLLKALLDKIDEASKRFGFFNIVNHQVPVELLDQIDKIMVDYYSRPIEERVKGGRRSQFNMRGFFDGEYTKNVMDWKQGFDWGVFDNSLDGHDQGPVEMGEFKRILTEYWFHMSKLCGVISKAFSLLLGVDADFFASHFTEPHPSWARLNYYPKSDGTPRLGVNPHRDACFLTILKQDDNVPGLQVYLDAGDESKGDGITPETSHLWLTVPPVKGGLTVNIGEALQVWSNDKYFAALHRVVANNDMPRYSIPYFYMPHFDTNIVPILHGDERPKYRTLNWGEFRSKRNLGDYQKLEFKDQGRLPNWKILY